MGESQRMSSANGKVTAHFAADHRGRAWLYVHTGKALHHISAPFWAKFHILWCKLFHGRKFKRIERDDFVISKGVFWVGVRCMRCGCGYYKAEKR